MSKKIIIASRKSELARIQALLVAQRLQSELPDADIQHVFRASAGDQNLDQELSQSGSKGVFTEDFYQDLVGRQFDMVVHSWKDLPVEQREGSQIVATLPREDVRDVALFHPQFVPGQKKLRVLSSSPRRIHALKPFFEQFLPDPPEDIQFLSVRGNMQTRIAKMLAGEGDVLILAKAALDRIFENGLPEFDEFAKDLKDKIRNCRFMVTPIRVNPPAAAQGALAIEIRRDDHQLESVLQKLNVSEDFQNVLWERETLASLGGGCHQKIGVHQFTDHFGRRRVLRGVTEDGKNLDLDELYGNHLDAVEGVSLGQAWPKADERPDIQRCPIEDVQWPQGRDLLVTKSEAIQSIKGRPSDSDLLWCSGLKTWKKLAAEGFWVHGSLEGFGQHHLPSKISWWEKPLRWVKVTHDQAGDSQIEPLVSYRLNFDSIQVPTDRTFYFWSQEGLFDLAVQQGLDVNQVYHACGPGLTYQRLKQKVSHDRLFVYSDEDQWRESLNKESK